MRAKIGAAMLAATVIVLAPTAAAAQPGGAPVGPFRISPLGHPRLCWEAWGNGSPITLESCDTVLQGQEWTFTGNGVLMNGNGYCLQRGGPGQPGAPSAGSLYLSFSGQCAGSSRQDWTFTGPSDSFENPPAHLCAAVPGGALVPGATIAARPCARTASWVAWSQGVSDLTLSGPRGAARAKQRSGTARTGARRAFTAKVTVSNGPKAMTAYAASVVLRLPAGLTATRLTGTGALSNWACTVHTLTCRGNLPGASTGSVTVSGTVSSRAGVSAARSPVTAHATVAGTNQTPHAVLTATVPVSTYPMPTAAAAPAGATHGTPAASITTFVVIVAILLLTGGLFLAVTTRRRPHSPAP